MSLTKCILEFFQGIGNKPKENKTDLKTVKDLDIFDDVWIKEDGVIQKGWIYDISRRCITVVYGNGLRDFKFQIPRPMNVTEIVQGEKILYCNETKDKV